MKIWKISINFPNYEISEDGGVRKIIGGRIIYRKPYLSTTGRMMIVMRSKGIKKATHISRLVCEAFHGNAPTSTHQCAHNDGNPINDHYTNLRWATRSENEMDKVAHGTSNRGERFGRSKLKENQVVKIKLALKEGVHPSVLAAENGVAITTIKSIKQGKSWYWLIPDITTDCPALAQETEGAF
jgi:HNH endonuclease